MKGEGVCVTAGGPKGCPNPENKAVWSSLYVSAALSEININSLIKLPSKYSIFS